MTDANHPTDPQEDPLAKLQADLGALLANVDAGNLNADEDENDQASEDQSEASTTDNDTLDEDATDLIDEQIKQTIAVAEALVESSDAIENPPVDSEQADTQAAETENNDEDDDFDPFAAAAAGEIKMSEEEAEALMLAQMGITPEGSAEPGTQQDQDSAINHEAQAASQAASTPPPPTPAENAAAPADATIDADEDIDPIDAALAQHIQEAENAVPEDESTPSEPASETAATTPTPSATAASAEEQSTQTADPATASAQITVKTETSPPQNNQQPDNKQPAAEQVTGEAESSTKTPNASDEASKKSSGEVIDPFAAAAAGEIKMSEEEAEALMLAQMGLAPEGESPEAEPEAAAEEIAEETPQTTEATEQTDTEDDFDPFAAAAAGEIKMSEEEAEALMLQKMGLAPEGDSPNVEPEAAPEAAAEEAPQTTEAAEQTDTEDDFDPFAAAAAGEIKMSEEEAEALMLQKMGLAPEGGSPQVAPDAAPEEAAKKAPAAASEATPPEQSLPPKSAAEPQNATEKQISQQEAENAELAEELAELNQTLEASQQSVAAAEPAEESDDLDISNQLDAMIAEVSQDSGEEKAPAAQADLDPSDPMASLINDVDAGSDMTPTDAQALDQQLDELIGEADPEQTPADLTEQAEQATSEIQTDSSEPANIDELDDQLAVEADDVLDGGFEDIGDVLGEDSDALDLDAAFETPEDILTETEQTGATAEDVANELDEDALADRIAQHESQLNEAQKQSEQSQDHEQASDEPQMIIQGGLPQRIKRVMASCMRICHKLPMKPVAHQANRVTKSTCAVMNIPARIIDEEWRNTLGWFVILQLASTAAFVIVGLVRNFL